MRATYADTIRANGLGVSLPYEPQEFHVPDRLIDDVLQAKFDRKMRTRQMRIAVGQYEHLVNSTDAAERRSSRAVRHKRRFAHIATKCRLATRSLQCMVVVLAIVALVGWCR